MKENSFNNMMMENMSQYKQAYSNLNTTQTDLVSPRLFDDEITNNINQQFNYVKIVFKI